MSVIDVCALCGFRHNVAHRCGVYRLNASAWVRAADASAWSMAVPVHALEEFDVVCPHCRARSWRGENMDCCGGGRLQLPIADDNVPAELADIILSSHVRQHIRRSVGFCGDGAL
jgi:hypothetical protein